jgi:hypothetical protein
VPEPAYLSDLMRDVESGKFDDLTIRQLKTMATAETPFQNKLGESASFVSVVVLIIFGDAQAPQIDPGAATRDVGE